MPEYEVVKVHDSVREWSSTKGGKMKSYRVDVKDPDSGNVLTNGGKGIELAQKETTAAPTVGQKLDRTGIEKRTYGDPPKDDYKFGPRTQGAGGGGGGGRAWKPRPDDSPSIYAAKQASIARQHSQDMAMRVLELAERNSEDPNTVMERLGVQVELHDRTLGLVEAFSFDVGRAAVEAMDREKQHHNVANAMKEVA